MIYFKEWAPGGEYSQKIVVKNTGKKMQEIRYVLPESKYFSMAFPDPIRLAPGNAVNVDVLFRPVIYEPYDDMVEFICPSGNFFVRVIATVKQLVVALPEMLDFNFVAVNELAEREIEIHNIGELDANFEWRLTGPFQLNPMKGCIPPDGYTTIRIGFHPKEANVFVARAMLDVADPSGKQTQTKEFRSSAIAKYPHLVTAEHVMEFGDVLTDQKAEKTFFLKNDSLVDAIFEVTPQEDDVDPVFFFTPMRGLIPPEGDVQMKIRYTAISSDTFSASNFTIKTAGGNVLHMRCTGRSIGPTVRLSQTSINFGDLLLGPTRVDGTREPPTYSRSFQIINSSDIPVEFTFVASPDGMFGFNITSSTILPRSYENIIVSFTPRYHAYNFYKRVTCLIKNQGSLFLDMLCTCVDPDDKRRPAQLTMKHVKQYHHFLRSGITRVKEANMEATVDFLELNPGATPQVQGYLKPPHKDSYAIYDEPNYHQQMHAFFLGQEDARRDVSLDIDTLDFGGVISGQVETRTIQVRNRLGSKVVCFWQKPPEGGELPPAFEISPESKDIMAGDTETFTVTYKPSVSNEYFSETLECITLVKTTRTFRLVNEKTFCAPLSLMLNVAGHTVPPYAEHFIPKCTFSKERINFPGTLVSGARFQTIKVQNSATTPLQFAFLPDKSGIFTCKPSHGTIRPKQFCLVAIRFMPRSARLYEYRQQIRLNFSHTQEMQLIGTGYQPDISFGNEENGFYLRPTCVGGISEKTLELTNTTRIAVHYKWHVPDRLQKVLVIDYPEKVVQPNDTQLIKWTFAPKKPKLYMESFQLELLPCEKEFTGERQNIMSILPDLRTLDIIGDGAASGVNFEDDNLDFGAVLVNNTVQHEFFLVNRGTSNLTYVLSFDQQLALTQKDDEPDGGEQQSDIPPITYDIPTGHLRARSRKKIVATFAPTLRRFYKFTTYCHAVPDPVPAQGDTMFVPPEPDLSRPSGPLLCELPMAGVSTYPAIAFADVRRMGMNPYMLWKELGLDHINDALASEPGDFESNLNRAEGLVGGGGYTGIIDALEVFDMHFPPMVRKSPAIMVTFKLENQGHLPVDWSMTYPTEKQVEVELWAEAEEPGPRELRWMDIVTKKLFAVEPRKGSLKPGEMQILTIVFQYTHIDEPWELPIILQAKKGRRIVLNLVGHTLEPSIRTLHFAHKPFGEAEHVLQPVMIGEKNPPVQTQLLQNPGVQTLEYEIDTTACDEIQAQNYGFRIFECENPRGTVAAGGSIKVRWIFHPLEAKLYEMKVRMRIMGTNSSYQVVLRGQGFHPQIMAGSELHFRNHSSTFPRLPGFHWYWQPTLGSATDRLVLDKQVGSLNPDFCSFGHVPLHSVSHRLVMVRNMSADAVTFTWDDNNQLLQANGGFTIAPMLGRLDAGEHAICKLTYHPVLRAELVEADIVCIVQPEQPPEEEDDNLAEDEEKTAKDAAAAAKRQELEASKASGHQTLMERQQYAETRDGVPCYATRSLPPGFTPDIPALMGEGSQGAGNPFDTDSNKGSMKGSIKGGGNRRSSLNAAQDMLPAIMEDDAKYRLYINIQASALTSDSYRRLHPNYNQFLLETATDVYPNTAVPDQAGYAGKAAPAVIKNAMAALMKEVILDIDIKHAFTTVDNRPVPYFCQYSSAAPSPATLRAAALVERVKEMPPEEDPPLEQTVALEAKEDLAAKDEPAAEGEDGALEDTAPLEAIVEGEGDGEGGGEGAVVEGAGASGRSSAQPEPSLEEMTAENKEAMAVAKARAMIRRHTKLAEQKLEADALRKLHRDEDFYCMMNRTLENTLSNLVSEASYGEFDPTRAPRQIVEIVGEAEGWADTNGDTMLDTLVQP